MNRAVSFALLLPALLLAGNLTYTASFSRSELRFSQADGYDVVEMRSGITVPDPGRPALPEVPLTLAVPAGARVTGVSVTPMVVEQVQGRYRLYPSQPARPISRPGAGFTGPDALVYRSSRPYPGRHCREFRTGSATGFRLVSVNLLPLQYYPVEGRLVLATRMQVRIEYEEDPALSQQLTATQRERAAAGLRALVANPDDLLRFGPLVQETDLPEISYLVVTNDAMASEFRPFLEYRTRRGLRAELRTVEWVSRNYPGRDLQERIRNLITDYYQHRGLTYVLLAGDNGQVPGRRIRLNVFDEPGDIPTDLYYGDLDFSWDSNRNNLFGEMGDSVDLYADVLVGRASVDKISEVRNFIAKVMTYENNPAPDYIKRTLLPSGWLWRSIGYHGKFVNDSIADLSPVGWTDRKLEDPASALVVAESLNHGFAMFDPAGHGNSSGVYDEGGTAIYVTGTARSQRNYRRYAIITSLACDPGDFEAEDCLAEAALNCDSAGCIGAMLNSRYGWGTPPQMGPSEKLCVRFYDYFFNLNEFVIGACHNRSREEYAGVSQWSSLWRWCMTEFNLFGDPALDIWSDVPGQLSAESADTLMTGSSSLAVTVRSGGTGMNGALVCAWKDGEVFATGRTSGSGSVQLAVHPATTGVLKVTATAHNCLPATRDVVVAQGAAEPCIVIARVEVDDAGQSNPNGILDPGETAVLTLELRNAGAAPATNTTVVIQSLVPGISTPDSTAACGTIQAGGTARSDGLSVAAGPDVMPGSNPQFAARVTSDEGTWELSFSIDIGYPGRAYADIDTGEVALTVTAGGTVGVDLDAGRRGRGFRYPKSDTTCLNIASFCLAGCGEYIADRFYNQADGIDADWRMAESVVSRAPVWNADEYMTSAFTDAGHPRRHNVYVRQQALGLDGADWVVLVYDLENNGGEQINGYVGLLADFDMRPSDRFHDLAYTDMGLATAYMRSVSYAGRWCGVKLLTSTAAAHVGCIDHGIYINPDSGFSESMKYRTMTGQLGASGSDRPYNWSVAVSTGPLSLPSGGGQRVAFALVAAGDSVSYLDACRDCQVWYDANVGVLEGPASAGYDRALTATVVRGYLLLQTPVPGHRASYSLFGISGRKVMELKPGANDVRQLPAGVYLLRQSDNSGSTVRRLTLVR